MKTFLIFSAIIFATLTKHHVANAQKVLTKENGVSLSYSTEYVNTLKCGDSNFDQYKVTAYLENNSGHTINIGYSKVEHTSYRNQLDVSPCRHPFPAGATIDIKYNWASGSISQVSYYVLVPNGERYPNPDWSLGQFSFVN